MAGHRPQSGDGVIAEVALPRWRYVAGRGLHGRPSVRHHSCRLGAPDAVPRRPRFHVLWLPRLCVLRRPRLHVLRLPWLRGLDADCPRGPARSTQTTAAKPPCRSRHQTASTTRRRARGIFS